MKLNFKKRLIAAFSWDTSNLPTYVDEQADDVETEIIYGSGLISRVSVDENVKGDSKTIKTMLTDLPLQEVTACVMSDDGTIEFKGVNLECKTVGVQMSLCNQDLEGKWSEMLLAIGANRKNRDMPLEDVITAFVVKSNKKKIQDLLFKGDTSSLDPELLIMDGLIKKWKNDPLVNSYSGTLPLSSTNALANFLGVYGEIPSELFDADMDLEIICSRADARLLIQGVYNDKDYSANLDVTEEAGELSFILPTTSTRVRTYPQLSTGEIYAVPYRFIYVGTELQSDFDGFEIKYLEESEVLRASNKMKIGVNYIFPKYFAKLDEAAS